MRHSDFQPATALSLMLAALVLMLGVDLLLHDTIAQIFDVGYAAFADVGRTWGSNPALPEGTAGQSLYGVGLGIRLLSSHSSRGTMIHIDLTKALHEEGDVSGFEWRILAKRRF